MEENAERAAERNAEGNVKERVKVEGHCHPRFERVRALFEAGFESGAEQGASLAVELDGECVLDCWGGFADKRRERPWQRDTLANVFSTTKGLTALCAHRLIERGELALDAPVARYWPEFAQAGKQAVSVRQLISHQAGLPALREKLPTEALFDWQRMTDALAAERPWWEPGTRHGYHAVTFGWLVGELVRRVSGRSLGRFLREEIAEPLAADFFVGFGPELDSRVANLVQGPIVGDEPSPLLTRILNEPQSMTALAFLNPNVMGNVWRSRDWRAAEIPAANGHASAAGLARIYGAVAQGDAGGVLSSAAIDVAREEQVCGEDAVLGLVTRIANGFMLAPPQERTGPNPHAFGHAGAGGSYGFCDPEAGLGFGYVMNRMHVGAWLVDPRPRALLDAVYEALGQDG